MDRTGLSRREVLKGGAVAGAALAAGAVSPERAAEAATPKQGGTLRVNGYDPRGFDMHLSRSYRTQTTLSFIHNNLFRFKAGPDVRIGRLEVEPDLVETWKQEDPVTYVFKLREGVRWHDKPPVNGREFVADDVKYSLDRFLTIPGNARRSNLEMIDKVEVINQYTVKITLKRPYVWFLDQLADAMTSAMIAREAVDKFGDLKKPEAAIGTGPWILEKYDPNVQVTFVRNPDYYRKGQPYADKVEWIVISDNATRQSAYRAGKFDFGWQFICTVQVDEVEQLKKQHPDWHYKPFLWDVVDRMMFRTDRKDLPYHKVDVRRAISLGIDTQGAIDALNEGQGSMSTAIPPALIDWAIPIDKLGPGAEWYEYNPAKAKKLLAKAGYPKGFKAKMEFTPQYGARHKEAAELMVDMLSEIGVQVTLVPKDYGYYIKKTTKGDYPEMSYGLMGARTVPESYLTMLYHPKSPINGSKVNDKKMMELIAKQSVTQDIEARREVYAEIQRYAADQMYYVYGGAGVYVASWQPHIKNFNTNLGFDYGWRMQQAWVDKA